MAQGEFTLQADLVPVIDERQLQAQAQVLVKNFNSILAKSMKPISLGIDTKAIEQTKKINIEIEKAQKNAANLNKQFAGTQTTLSQLGNTASAALNRVTRSLSDLSSKAFAGLTTQLDKIAPAASRVLESAKASFTKLSDVSRNVFLKISDGLNVTNTKLISFTGSIRGAIRENDRFKTSFNELSKSASLLNQLPTQFKVLQAQIASGTSGLQKQAQAGDGFSQSLVPFLIIGATVVRQIDKISESLRTVAHDISLVSKAAVPDKLQRLDEVFQALGKDGDSFKASFTRIASTLPAAQVDKLTNSLLAARGQGVEPVIKAFVSLRDELSTSFKGKGISGFLASLIVEMKEGKEATLPLRTAVGQLNTELFGLGAKGEVPGLRRFGLEAKQTLDTVATAVHGVSTTILELERTVPDAVVNKIVPAIANNLVKAFNLADEAAKNLSLTIGGIGGGGGGGTSKLKEELNKNGKEIDNFVQRARASLSTVSLTPSPLTPIKLDIGKAGPLGNSPSVINPRAAEETKVLTDELRRMGQVGTTSFNNVSGATKVLSNQFLPLMNTQIKDITSGITAAGKAGGKGGILSGILGGGGGGGGAGITGALGGLKQVFSVITGGTFVGTASIIGLGTAALQSAAKFERLRVALQGILGELAGQKALDDIAAFAAVTPFQLETATQSVIKLTSTFQGLQASGAIAILEQIAGAAAAVGASDDAINRVVLAMTQIQAVGKVTADNLRQVTEALPSISKVAITKELAENLGVSRDEAKRLLSEGLVPATQGLQALVTAANKVPGATEALGKQSKTFNGLLSTTKDLTAQFLAEAGKPILAAAATALTVINIALTGLTATIKGGLAVFAEFKTILTGLGIAVGTLGVIFAGTAAGILAPLAAVTAGVAGIVIGTQKLLDIFAKGSAVAQRFSNGLNKLSGGLLGSKSAGDQANATLETTAQKLDKAKRALDPVLRSFDALLAAEGNFDVISIKVQDYADAVEEASHQANQALIGTLEKILDLSGVYDRQTAAGKAVAEATARIAEAQEKHNKEIADKGIALNKELAEAIKGVTEANEAAVSAQATLTKALEGASSQELERADMSLASAKLRLRQIIEDERKSQEQLNVVQQVGINLSGLTLDQVRTRLKVTKASLAAQKVVNKVAADARSAEQKSIDQSQGAITKRSAELDVLDAVKETEAIRLRGSEKDPEVIAARKAVTDANIAAGDALIRQQDIQTEINKLNEKDIDFEKELIGLQEARTAALREQKKANDDIALAIAKATGDEETIKQIYADRIKDNPKLVAAAEELRVPVDQRLALEKLIGIELDKNAEKGKTEAERINDIFKSILNDPAIKELDKKIIILEQAIANKSLIGETPAVQKIIQDLFAIDKDNQAVIDEQIRSLREELRKNTNFTDQAIEDLFINPAKNAVTLNVALTGIRDENQDLSDKEVKKAIEEALKTIPNLSDFHFADGLVANQPTPGIFGEAGREAILPLTRPGKLMNILSNRHVLPPVLASLEKMSLSSFAAPRINPIDLSTVSSGVSLGAPGSRGGLGISKQEQSKRDQSLARAIVAEMQAAGFTGNQITMHNDFTTPDSKDPLSSVQIRQIAREVKRQIEKDW